MKPADCRLAPGRSGSFGGEMRATIEKVGTLVTPVDAEQ
jgi:hypothetical protein